DILKSYIGDQIVVFVVLVLAAVALSNVRDAGHEFDRLDPLHHLVAELVLDPEPQRGAVDPVERPAVHLVGEDALGVKYVGHAVAVVVFAAVKSFAKGMEYDEPGLRRGLDELGELREREAAPFGDP